MAQFSVVIINYNGKEYLRRCLNNVKANGLKPTKVIVVDDASSDGSFEMVKDEFPEFITIKNEKNSGPTKSRNTGAKEASGDYIIFLDNDLLARENTFEKLTDFMEKNSQAGICCPKLKPKDREKMWWNMGYDPNNFREAVGYAFGFLLKIFPKSKLLKRTSMLFILNYWDYDKLLAVDWVVERCFIIRKNIFDEIGGFDEKFFMFFEGPDICKRIRQKGYKVFFNPEIEVDLLDSHTHNRYKRSLWHIKSKYYFYKKHYFYRKSNPVLFWLGRTISGILYLIA